MLSNFALLPAEQLPFEVLEILVAGDTENELIIQFLELMDGNDEILDKLIAETGSSREQLELLKEEGKKRFVFKELDKLLLGTSEKRMARLQ